MAFGGSVRFAFQRKCVPSTLALARGVLAVVSGYVVLGPDPIAMQVAALGGLAHRTAFGVRSKAS
jgi:hypothetical protein